MRGDEKPQLFLSRTLDGAAPTLLEIQKMSAERPVIPGVVNNGLVVPQNDTPLPDGVHVEIVLGACEVTPELQAELDQWDKASDEAWSMINEWGRRRV